ncbi:hypothetical protein MUP79_00305 [Candidatus Bathyarchaeota archaeon]|nr:hypothetical protein [Candidatus Bathyarchaeota archaeon]
MSSNLRVSAFTVISTINPMILPVAVSSSVSDVMAYAERKDADVFEGSDRFA